MHKVILCLLISSLASRAQNPDPCASSTWAGNSKPFDTGNVGIPGTNTTVKFDAILKWQEKSNGPKICKLKDPSIEFHGTITGHPVVVGNKTYKFDIEIEGFTGGDQFLIDSTVVDGQAYGLAAGAVMTPAGGVSSPTSTSTIGNRTVTWIWKNIPQPSKVAITGAEGNKIELKHTSPSIRVTRVINSAGNPVALTNDNGVLKENGTGKVFYPSNGWASSWKMAHAVQIN